VSGRLSLLIDADDTLWENNIYFEQAFDNFCDFLDHSALTPQQVRDVLNEIELVNAKIHGYGSKNFGRNLQQAYRHLAEREIRFLLKAIPRSNC
jgi:putative hydrolase of the HAD superfamily